jgi:hypothetical protein
MEELMRRRTDKVIKRGVVKVEAGHQNNGRFSATASVLGTEILWAFNCRSLEDATAELGGLLNETAESMNDLAELMKAD